MQKDYTRENLPTFFLDLVKTHSQTLMQGNSVKVNNINDQLIGLKKLSKENNYLEEFRTYLKSEDGDIKKWAAIFLLGSNFHSEAVESLEQIIAEDTLESFNAKAILELWEKGLLE